ncbi:hypothetical protein [Streptomyces sp. NRRL WC-3618]|uniref:TreTu family toxin n=1 Tax=Streptomyces sp. NRRL WC-3618 TaxID=1519490 RepID=UPI003B63A15A
MVTVGRWMSGAEHQAVMETGMVQRGGGGFTYVAYPASRDAYISARPGSVYAEFGVPKYSLIPGGRSGDFKMSDSDTIFARLAQKKGGPVPQLPEAKNIKTSCSSCRTRRGPVGHGDRVVVPDRVVPVAVAVVIVGVPGRRGRCYGACRQSEQSAGQCDGCCRREDQASGRAYGHVSPAVREALRLPSVVWSPPSGQGIGRAAP